VKKALYGYGGHAREVYRQMEEELVFFVDDNYSNEIAKPISEFDPEKFELMIAISNPKDRCDIVSRLPEGTKYFTFIHPTALILDKNIEVMEGSFIGAYSILTTNIKIGKHAILNRANHIGHDTVIGDYFSAMPGAIVSGNVIIRDRVYLGTNSSIREKISICDDATIGLNSGVVKNITSSGTYIGTPSKILR
jgi:sugar O-acyltransferase (sialic acid O-acetyltransferase NeuD family)